MPDDHRAPQASPSVRIGLTRGNFPPVLYKYLRPEHVCGMVERGVVRVGTLYEYRDVEQHGTEVGDADEGKQTYTDPNSFADFTKPGTVPWYVEAVVGAPPGADLLATNNHIVVIDRAFDCYVYCLSIEFDAAAMRKMGYGAAVRIHHPAMFMSGLNKALFESTDGVANAQGRKVEYVGRNRDARTEPRRSPVFVKDTRFAYQTEYHAAWDSRIRPISPVILSSTVIAASCEAV